MDMGNSRALERFLAWARYVYWADVERQQYDDYESAEDEPATGLSFVLMVQWYAALFVSIEAWRKSELTDPIVDELLSDPAFVRNVSLLRRFRNGVYHYQESLIDERLRGFLANSAVTVPWAFLLHAEFKRVVWELAHPTDAQGPIADELASVIERTIGWLPTEIIEAAPHSAAKHYSEVTDMLTESGDTSSPEAKALLDAAHNLQTIASLTTADWASKKREMIESLKKAAREEAGT